MTRLVPLLTAAAALFVATPAFAQTVGTCARGGGANQPQAVWVLFDLGSAHVRPEDKAQITEAVKTARDRHVTSVCLVGHTDKLGDKAVNAKLARERSQAVAAELIRAGYPAQDIVIAADPEAFGNTSLGGSDSSDKDRKVTILFSR
jgi:outer membrane protein OmpA-like peptidoglycan-associated protein